MRRIDHVVVAVRDLDEAMRKIPALPGVKSAAYAMCPLLNGREWDLTIVVQGHQAEQGEDMQVYYNLVSPGYWHAMSIPLLRGRDFDERDRVDGGEDPQPWNVPIVNREFAEHFFGAEDRFRTSHPVLYMLDCGL